MTSFRDESVERANRIGRGEVSLPDAAFAVRAELLALLLRCSRYRHPLRHKKISDAIEVLDSFEDSVRTLDG